MKLKDIKKLVELGFAKDITSYSTKEFQELFEKERGFDKRIFTQGKYGSNGALLLGCKTKQVYAVIGGHPCV